MIHTLWTYAWRTVLVMGVLLTLIAVSETIDLYLSLRQLSPGLAFAFAGAVGLLLVAGSVYLLVATLRRPKVLKPPSPDAGIRTQALYLARYARRLSINPAVAESDQAACLEAAGELQRLHRGHDEAAIEHCLENLLATVINPTAQQLSGQAEAEVRRCVRDVMLGVTVSPYRGGDLLIVIYRNGALFLRVMTIYGGRPALRESVQIATDVLRVVAAVNFINLGKNLIESLCSQIPVIGNFVDDIAQGVGAGFLTSAGGHALIDRCDPHRAWDERAAIDSMSDKSVLFLTDVRNMFTKEVLPDLRSRIRTSVTQEEADAPGFWDRISTGVETAIDSTSDGMNSYLIRPTLAGGRAVAGTSTRAGRVIGRNAQRAGAAVTQGVSTGGTALKRSASESGSAIRSALRWRPRRADGRSYEERPDQTSEPKAESSAPKRGIATATRGGDRGREEASEETQNVRRRRWIPFRGKDTR